MEYFENNFTAPPSSDKIVMWRFLRNRWLILRLHRLTIFRALTYFCAPRGHLSDSMTSVYIFTTAQGDFHGERGAEPTGWSKKGYPYFNVAITSANVNRF